MNHDDGNGSQVDVRLRRAARSFRSAASQLQPHAPADLERFERFRARKLRNERRAALVVAALVALLIAAVLVRWQPRAGTPVGPVPSPSKGRIVFGRSAPGLEQRSLFAIAPDGSHEQRLPITYTDCGEWSPDGSRLHVTASEYPGAPLRPAVVDVDGSGFEILDTSASADLNLGCGDWSPDGVRLVLEGFGPAGKDGIYSVSVDAGSGLLRLTHGQDVVPQYSPDGSAIVFQRTAAGRRDGRGAALFVVDPDGSDLRRITPWGMARSAGSWGPDGRIVFVGPTDSLWTIDAHGGGAARIPVTLAGRPYQPRWSPDGATIVFGLRSGGQTDIDTVRPDGSGLTQITNTPTADEWWPDWGVG